MSDSIDIGFVEEKPNWLLHPRFFPSKVGGKPAWLDLRNVPEITELFCKKCKDPLVFLCQVYAPLQDCDDCFHRTIFVFICRNGSCCQINSVDNLLILRCQLPRRNEYYSFEPYEENKMERFPIRWAILCILCGLKAPSHCSRCKKVFYCSRKHQIIDWQKGHKNICHVLQNEPAEYLVNNFIVTPAGKSFLFKEWEIVVDDETKEEASDIDPNQEMEKFKKLIQEKKAGTLSNISESELEQYTGTLPEDKVFSKFTKRIARHPDQVLRYIRGGMPLWITGNPDNIIDIPNCQYCNGERHFEFQIMPQLLNFLNIGVDLNGIDWGVIAVYTCQASCHAGPAYKQEFVIKQDFTN